MSSIKSAITAAVEEAYRCDAEERKKRLKQLQLRWHPGGRPGRARLSDGGEHARV